MRQLTRTLLRVFLMATFIFGLSFGASAEPGRGQDKGASSAGPPAVTERGEAREDSGKPATTGLERRDEARSAEKGENDGTPPKGLEKQREMKTEQERKEAGKGSEQGQKSREEHSRKWWKFWE